MNQSSSDANIAAAYDEWSNSYDTNENKTRDLATNALQRSHLNLAGRDVVEVGCGTGRNTIWLAEQVASLVALDFSEGMLERARQRLQGNSRVRFIQHDIRKLWPLADQCADIVIATLVLEHVEHLSLVFEQASRVLRSEGEAFICELHPMRQLLGGQAQFTKAATGERELVPAFLHSISDYVNEAIGARFMIERVNEWRDDEALIKSPPRLLSLLLKKQQKLR